MMKLQQLLLILGYFLCHGWGAEVKQQKQLVTVNVGDPVEMPCYQSETNYFSMFWYQQKPGQGLKLIVWSTAAKDYTMEEAYKDTWTLTRDDTHNSLLRLKNASKEDQAVYFCAASLAGGGNERQYFGQGTILSVLGEKEEQIDPKVRIFSPNKQEFKEHGLISLVCVATGFFPQHVRLTWYLNGEKIESLYQSVPKIDNDKTYSTSSRLSLTESQYFNPDTKIRCEAAFVGSNSSASDETYGELGCGVSKESYGRYMNQGKISYIMVLFKSGLYAVIVLAVIRRRKALSGSC